MSETAEARCRATSRRLGAALCLALAGALLVACTKDASTPVPTGEASAEGAGTEALATSAAPATPTLESVAQATALMAARLPVFDHFIGTSGTADGQLRLPFDVALAPDGSLYVSDSTGVQRFNADGTFRYRVGGTDLPQAAGIAVGSDGHLYVTGYGAEVHVYDDAGTAVGSLAPAGTGMGETSDPVEVAVDGKGNVYVADRGSHSVKEFTPAGQLVQTFGRQGTGNGEFTIPWSVAIDDEGTVYISSADDYLIQRFTPDGQYIDSFGQAHASDVVWQTAGLSFDSEGRLYALQTPRQVIQSFDVTHKPPLIRWEFGALGSDPGQFQAPRGMTIVDDMVYVADTSNDRVQVLRLQPGK